MRGVARKLEIRLDVQDVVAKIKLGDQYLMAPIENNVLTIPLSEPLRPAPGMVRSLYIETRRPLPASAPKNYIFSGIPLSNAADHSGAIGIRQSANLWVNVTTAQGLRRIDPRELPTDLRANPGTSIAYQFLDQPFKLNFSVESSPPLYRAETATRLDLDADMARSTTSIQVQRVRGRLFEIQVAIPPGLELLSVGPAEWVESATPTQGTQRAEGDNPSSQTEQIHKIQLTPSARDQSSLTLRLRGQQRHWPGRTHEAGAIRASRRGLHRYHGDALRGPQHHVRCGR